MLAPHSMPLPVSRLLIFLLIVHVDSASIRAPFVHQAETMHWLNASTYSVLAHEVPDFGQLFTAAISPLQRTSQERAFIQVSRSPCTVGM